VVKGVAMRWLALCAVAALAVLPWVIGGRYVLHVSTMIAIMATLALGMNLMLQIGQLSMAHSAFMGIGAYASALLTMRLGVPVLLALPLSGLLCALTAGLLGPVFLRIKGVYFVLLTFAFGQIVTLVFQEWTGLFGGNSGLHGIPKLSAFGHRLTEPAGIYGVALALALASFALVRGILRSDIGAMLRAVEADEPLSRSLGANAQAWRLAVFMLTAAMAGVAGSLYAHVLGFLSPAAFGFGLSVDLVVMNVIGGTASAWGPLLGALLVVPLPELLRGVKEYQLLTYGLVLIVFLLFFRDGLVGMATALARRRAPRAAAPPTPARVPDGKRAAT
jgi:branched-chain amino acid transport system permease protein